MTRALHIAVGAIATLVASVPAQAWACPVCGANKDDAARKAFFDTTVFLTLLPLAMFGGIMFWIVKRAQASTGSDQASFDEAEVSRTELPAPADTRA